MKRPPKRLLIFAALILLPLAAWFGSPRLRAAVYELAVIHGPDATPRSWCVDRLAGLGADGAPSLVSLLALRPGTQEHERLLDRVGRSLSDGAPASLPALGFGLRDPDLEVRRRSAFVLQRTTLHGSAVDHFDGAQFFFSGERHLFSASSMLNGPVPAERRPRYEPLLPGLLRGVGDPDAKVRAHCYYVLAALPELAPRALPQALKDIRGPDQDLTRGGRALVAAAGPAAIPELKRGLPALLEELEGRGVGQTGPSSPSYPVVIRRDADPLADAAGFVLGALIRLKILDEETLAWALRRRDFLLRHAVIDALLDTRGPRGVRALLPDPEARWMCEQLCEYRRAVERLRRARR